ncbi:MAG: hypothetical protein IKF11_10055 [Methanobrevibacter sp.]|nr:hypothetical protein [Methanobrevibacter sp.]
MSENETYSKPIKLDATKISVVLKLESEWLLTYIELSGNTKHLQINESKIKEHLEFNNLNVVNDIIKIQYTIEGLNQ